ncbi:hypothetical protein INT47_008472, partial [Mucor saturninus]
MALRIVILYLLRCITLVLSLGTLGCHVDSGAGPWWPDFIPYILYYVGPIVSILSIFILLILGCIQSKSLLSDRVMSIINLLLFIAIAVYNSLQSGTIPWTGNLTKQFTSNTKGYASYCSNYEDNRTSIRCWLVNGAWMGTIVVGFFWLLLALYTLIQRNSDVYNEDYDAYDYKEDVPMAIRPPSSVQHLPSPPKHQSHGGYTSPILPQQQQQQQHHHQSYTPPVQNNGYYYHQQQPQTYDTSNDYNNDYYLNPVQEEHMNMGYRQHDSLVNNGGYERSRKVSKTYVEEIPANYSNISPSESVQPPHSYDGLV